MNEREVRYCTTEDGVRIAYCVEGDGPALIVCPQFADSFSLFHLFPPFDAYMRRLAEGRRLVLFDSRGCGLSQRDVDDLSIDGLVKDLEAVIKATKIRRFSLYGVVEGGTLALAYAARRSLQPQRIVLFAPIADAASQFNPDVAQGFARMARGNWQAAAAVFGNMMLSSGYPDAALQMTEIYRQSTTGEIMARWVEANCELNLLPELSVVACPTLVFAGTSSWVLPRAGDSDPLGASQKIAAALPDARLVQLEGPAIHPAVGDHEDALNSINQFLGNRVARSARSAAGAARLHTVLFTDLVGHTEMMSRLGDERGRDVLREHERITRDVLKANGGTEVKTMGDGFMASFGSVTKAVECAVALQRAFAAHPGEALNVRVGLNAGEPIEEGGDLFGATVILASRIAAKAGGGEILVADTVRGLCSGKGFVFSDRGEFVAKGFEEPVRVYEVSWRSPQP